MSNFIELTQCSDDEKIYINPKYISMMIPHNDIKTTTIKVVGCNYYYDVNESIKEIKDKIKKKKNKVEETKKFTDLLLKYPYDSSKENDFLYPMTATYMAPVPLNPYSNSISETITTTATTIKGKNDDD